MISFGIRFGEGFDKNTILRFMRKVPMEQDYELLVIGTNPGGVACAKEASLAGKRTAIVKWRHFSPAEKEIFNSELEENVEVLLEQKSSEDISGDSEVEVEIRISEEKAEKKRKKVPSVSHLPNADFKEKGRVKRIRKSNMDVVNELFKRGHQGRKLMHTVGNFNRVLENAQKSGWRVGSVNHRQTLNWRKMMDQVMDFVMEENWKLLHELGVEIITVREKGVQFVDNYTVEVEMINAEKELITADTICLALEAEFKFPSEIKGATNYAINCNDFIRMCEPPGKTLVVGGLPESMECAGILASCNFPVTVVSRSKILNGYDSEMGKVITHELKSLGVSFLENTTLTAIEPTHSGKLVSRYILPQQENEAKTPLEETKGEEFDTVLLTVGCETQLNFLNLNAAGIDYNSQTQKIYTNDEDQTTAPNIYAIGDAVAYRPQGFEISELAGRLLGKRLFHNTTENMSYVLYPIVMFTPTEYAFIGLSEDGAFQRFGEGCIDVYHTNFKPLEFVLPPKESQCLIKLIVLRPQDLVIGLHLFGPDAGEVIQGFATGFKFGLTMSKLKTVVGVHATKAQKIVKMTK